MECHPTHVESCLSRSFAVSLASVSLPRAARASALSARMRTEAEATSSARSRQKSALRWSPEERAEEDWERRRSTEEDPSKTEVASGEEDEEGSADLFENERQLRQIYAPFSAMNKK